ncbi:MAG TPA: alpha/beta-type small acid-soluble spore protein [Bacillota bacterium]|nr:alpha/beta-type small acid-soluble spore protein [Bacillota bacterium]
MPEKQNSQGQDAMDKLKWETAKEMGLDDDLAAGGDELTVREAGKIGGNMVKKLVEKGEEVLADEGGQSSE